MVVSSRSLPDVQVERRSAVQRLELSRSNRCPARSDSGRGAICVTSWVGASCGTAAAPGDGMPAAKSVSVNSQVPLNRSAHRRLRRALASHRCLRAAASRPAPAARACPRRGRSARSGHPLRWRCRSHRPMPSSPPRSSPRSSSASSAVCSSIACRCVRRIRSSGGSSVIAAAQLRLLDRRRIRDPLPGVVDRARSRSVAAATARTARHLARGAGLHRCRARDRRARSPRPSSPTGRDLAGADRHRRALRPDPDRGRRRLGMRTGADGRLAEQVEVDAVLAALEIQVDAAAGSSR